MNEEKHEQTASKLPANCLKTKSPGQVQAERGEPNLDDDGTISVQGDRTAC